MFNFILRVSKIDFTRKITNYSIFQVSYLVFFAILPFIYCESIIDPVLIPRQLFLTIFLLFVWVCLIFTKNQRNYCFQISKLSILLLVCNALLVVFSFISIIYSNTISESIYVSSKYGVVLLFLLTTYFLLSVGLVFKSDLIIGVLIFLVISLSYGAYDVIMLLVNNLSILNHPELITSTYANKNLFASMLLLGFWVLFASNDNRKYRYILVVVLISFVIILQSKIVAIAMGLMLIILANRNINLYFKERKVKKILGYSIIILVIATLVLNISKFENLTNLHTLNTRYSLWVNSIKMFVEYPFGVGSGNWQVYFPKYGLSQFDIPEVKNGMTLFQRPHNDFIWIICELGVHGLLTYLAMFTILILMLVRLIRKNNDFISFLLLITLIGYCMVAFFDFPLERIEHQVLLSVIVLITMNNYDISYMSNITINPFKHFLIHSVIISVSLTVCFYRVKGEYYTRQFIAIDKAENSNFVIENSRKAKSIFYSIDPMSIPVDWYAGVSLFSENKFDEAREKLESALNYSPYNIHILKNLGIIYDMQKDSIKALDYFNRALAISPTASFVTLKTH